MNLFDIAASFSADPEQWNISHPAKALSMDIHAKIRTRVGSLFAASDVSRRRTADRLGISLRPYEAGDTLNAVSVSQYIRTGELLTRVDLAPGRQSAGVVFLPSKSLSYKSEQYPCNKGQVALSIMALIECLHGNLLQSFECVALDAVNMASAQRKIRRWNRVYYITDLLDSPQQNEVFCEQLQSLGIRRPHVYIVRDPLEWIQNNPLGTSSAELQPLENQIQIKGNFFSGPLYLESLRKQLESTYQVVDHLGGQMHILTGENSILDCIDTLVHSLMVEK